MKTSLLSLVIYHAVAPLSLPAADPIAYVSSSAQDFITSFNPQTQQTTRLSNAGITGTSFVVSPDGTTAYVISTTPEPTISRQINVVDLTTGKLAGTLGVVALPFVTNLALSTDGTLLYFIGQNGLEVVDTASGTLVNEAPVQGACTCQIVVGPGAANIYIATDAGVGYPRRSDLRSDRNPRPLPLRCRLGLLPGRNETVSTYAGAEDGGFRGGHCD